MNKLIKIISISCVFFIAYELPIINDNAQEIPLQNRFAVIDQEEGVAQAVNDEVEEMILEWEGDENSFIELVKILQE